MKTIKRTQVRIETCQFIEVRRQGGLFRGWCSECGQPSPMLRLEEAAMAGVSLQAVSRFAAARKLHFAGTGGAADFICLNSLLKL
jgi:hypothetical protein